LEGIIDGSSLGLVDGDLVGLLEGIMEGSILGSPEGLDDGFRDGCLEGIIEGRSPIGGSSTNGLSVRKVKLLQLLSSKGYFDCLLYSEPCTLIWKKLSSQVLRVLFSENSKHFPTSNVPGT